MPQDLSAWVDICIGLLVIAGLLCVLSLYTPYAAAIGCAVLLSLFVYSRDRCRERQRQLEEYYKGVVKNVNELSNYAVEHMPVGILLVSGDGRLKWYNQEIVRWLGKTPQVGILVKDFFAKIVVAPVWGQDGSYVFADGARFFNVRHRYVSGADLMAFYLTDITSSANLERENLLAKPVLCYIQIDNYDEVLQGLSEPQRTAIVVAVNSILDEWAGAQGAFLKRVADDLYIAFLDRQSLDKVLKEKFDILDKVRAIHGANKFPVTLSLGVSVGSKSMFELGQEAQAGLDLALGRGGDQVAVQMDGKMQFYGGKAQAVEKHTRVKARVVAHALAEIIEGADLVLIMGHHNEDFDSFGAAMGVASMARHLGKKVHIVLSEINAGIDKFTEMIKDDASYGSLFISLKEAAMLTADNPLLFVVDTHIPHLVAAPFLLGRIEQKIVIDHHRRSESFIENPLLVYIEPASSSTSELVTELLMYFSEDLAIKKMNATALYAGMVVDTKNFAVQTGVRTFEAAAFLRRSGADPVLVRHLFRSDYETSLAKARTFSASEMFKGGLIVGTCPENLGNAQVIAAQIADAMLRIEDVRISMVLFSLGKDGVGISARSTGEINVQVIMEAFGGGGHQNVAGAQVKGINMEELKSKVVELCMKYIEESGQT